MAQDRSRERAERLLAHYMGTAFRGACLTWNSDNEAEIGMIVNALYEMIVDQIQEHAESAPHIYPDGSTS